MRTDTSPCDLCGTTEGDLIAGQHRRKPARYRGGPYGIEGSICRECRDDLVDEFIDNQAKALGVEGRVATIKRAKLDKLRRGLYGYGCDDLSREELDAALPPDGSRPRSGRFPFGEVG